MKHTKCKICGKEHALGGCPEFQSTAARNENVQNASGSFGKAGSNPGSKASMVKAPNKAEFKDQPADTQIDAWTSAIIQKHNERLAYQAQYQRDLRAATKLGISVKEFRAAKGNEE